MKTLTASVVTGGVSLAMALGGCGGSAGSSTAVPNRTIGVTLIAQVIRASSTPQDSPTPVPAPPATIAPAAELAVTAVPAATDTPTAPTAADAPTLAPLQSLPTLAPTPAVASVPAGTDGRATLLALHNGIRAQLGLAPYATAAQLDAAAQVQSDYLATIQQQTLWSLGARGHTGGDGSTYGQRIARAGYAPASSNESWVFSDSPAGCFDWWLNDAGHKPAIVSNDYTQVGFGLTPHSAGGIVCVTVYARPQ